LPSGSEQPIAAAAAGPEVAERPAIKVDGLSVTYRTTFENAPTLRSALVRFGRRQRIIREIEAIKDLSFHVPHGKVVGVVGANGAGKSTLMRTIAGILPPTAGRVEVDGRVSTLLALGVGFNRKLSGRDNVEFMDMPMRTYSSGMYGRLAFSVAVNMDPDILLIDEALSVGDARFRRKSFEKMRELCAQARTIMIVSHALGSIRELCDEAIWMHKGRLQMWDEPDPVIEAYTDFLEVREDAVTMEDV
jgi:ABC-type polysaccharide/polyol phosphate transport system ATPase subunit